MGMFVVTPATSFGPIYPQPDPSTFIWPSPNSNLSGYITPDGKKGTINFDPGGGSGSGPGPGPGMTATCQDCGNQAKKDCSHRRCRTCCRSRGFDCATHVKSTWVPAARRRERQLLGGGGGGGGGGGASSGSTSGVKKPRLVSSQTTSHTSNSNNTPPRSFETSSSHQDASFKETLPGQVRAPAVFKCVKVSSVDDGGDDEFAYQAVVKIGGHVFKGFLYDQGLEPRDGFPNFSDLHLGGGGVDPSDVYVASRGGGGLVGGSNYGNTTI
ncbi:hypothetical protein RND81_09G254300 [Saponaria officinalis]|uniref:Uncharacterized protein n=1 Tax=Saponaria officinalis TaxID=3572 RepID=A0AAW1IQT2_SAPOF